MVKLKTLTIIAYLTIAGAVSMALLYNYIGGIQYGYVFSAWYNLHHEAYIEMALFLWEIVYTFILMFYLPRVVRV